MKRHWNGYGRPFEPPLHDPMTASLAYSGESVLFKNPANLRARKNSKLPNRHLNLSHENFVVRASGDFGGVGGLEEQR